MLRRTLQTKWQDMLAKFHAVIRAVVSSRKVTIAAVHGHCLGGGAELAMVCDLVYTAENASWGFPEIKLGCYPPVAATALAALVGQKHAADLILTGRSITGTEAARIGLANRAVGEGEVEGSAGGGPTTFEAKPGCAGRLPRRRTTPGTRCTLTKGWRGRRRSISRS